MTEIARFIIIAGLALTALGILLLLIGKVPGVGKLPGDILIKKDNFTFYFPLATCILVSILLTVVMQLFSRK